MEIGAHASKSTPVLTKTESPNVTSVLPAQRTPENIRRSRAFIPETRRRTRRMRECTIGLPTKAFNQKLVMTPIRSLYIATVRKPSDGPLWQRWAFKAAGRFMNP
jgi:hypothetical protein